MAKKIKKEIVDTNVILRFLVGDDTIQQEKARELFLRAKKRERKLVIKTLVVAEVCFVLESFYKKRREEITEAFEVFLSQKWLEVEERDILLLLWSWYKKGLHFVDCYLLSWAKSNHSQIVTFDKKLQNLCSGATNNKSC